MDPDQRAPLRKHIYMYIYIYIKRERERDLVLGIELLFELGDFTFLGGGEVLGVVATHLCVCVSSSSLSERERERKTKKKKSENGEMAMVETEKSLFSFKNYCACVINSPFVFVWL